MQMLDVPFLPVNTKGGLSLPLLESHIEYLTGDAVLWRAMDLLLTEIKDQDDFEDKEAKAWQAFWRLWLFWAEQFDFLPWFSLTC